MTYINAIVKDGNVEVDWSWEPKAQKPTTDLIFEDNDYLSNIPSGILDQKMFPDGNYASEISSEGSDSSGYNVTITLTEL